MKNLKKMKTHLSIKELGIKEIELIGKGNNFYRIYTDVSLETISRIESEIPEFTEAKVILENGRMYALQKDLILEPYEEYWAGISIDDISSSIGDLWQTQNILMNERSLFNAVKYILYNSQEPNDMSN